MSSCRDAEWLIFQEMVNRPGGCCWSRPTPALGVTGLELPAWWVQGSRSAPKQGPYTGCEGLCDPATMGATSPLTRAPGCARGCVADALAFCLLRARGRAAPPGAAVREDPEPFPLCISLNLPMSGRGLCLVLWPGSCFEVSVEWTVPSVAPMFQTKLSQSGSGSRCGSITPANVAASDQ